jgi:F420-dependent oxidoreductase-like protein
MVEGQEDVSWSEWLALARACEDGGLEGLFRSDHYLSIGGPPGRGSLDAWTTLAGIAAVTERIKLGTAVSPATFRHPSLLAKAVVTVDHISNGRVELGLGAGWYEAEHRAYGFPFVDTATRLEVLEEQVEIVVRSWDEGPFGFEGKHYRIEELDARPKPLQRPRPNLIIGGAAKPRSAALAARWANEYNTVSSTPSELERKRKSVEAAFGAADRDVEELTFSLMTGCVIGRDERDLRSRGEHWMSKTGFDGSYEDWLEYRANKSITGTIDQAVDQLKRYESAGVDRIMLQHIVHTDVDMVGLIGAEIVPRMQPGSRPAVSGPRPVTNSPSTADAVQANGRSSP